MKNGLLIWNVLLTIVCGYLLFVNFGSKKVTSEVTRNAGKSDTSISNKTFRIAYFEMDSVENNFQMVIDVKSEINKREEVINLELEKLDRAYKSKISTYQGQAQTMTQQQSEEATQEVMRMQEQMKTTKQQLDQDYNEFVAVRMNNIKANIESFLKEYNKAGHWSYIIAFEQGLFYYKDSAYNITNDVIKGLNELYKQKNKKG